MYVSIPVELHVAFFVTVLVAPFVKFASIFKPCRVHFYTCTSVEMILIIKWVGNLRSGCGVHVLSHMVCIWFHFGFICAWSATVSPFLLGFIKALTSGVDR